SMSMRSVWTVLRSVARSVRCVVCILFILTNAATRVDAGSTIYVDKSAPPGGNGSSWNLAFNDLQGALAIAQSGDTVRIGNGTYKPGAAGASRAVTFNIPSG